MAKKKKVARIFQKNLIQDILPFRSKCNPPCREGFTCVPVHLQGGGFRWECRPIED